MANDPGTEAKHCIEGFVCFCRNIQQRTKANNIFLQMSEKMVLDLLHNLARIDQRSNIQDIGCRDVNVGLLRTI